MSVKEKNKYTPDFSNAQAGDKCFSTVDGPTRIGDRYDNDHTSCVTVKHHNGNWAEYQYDGRYDTVDPHPTLFNDMWQFVNYWACELGKQLAKDQIDMIREAAERPPMDNPDGHFEVFDAITRGFERLEKMEEERTPVPKRTIELVNINDIPDPGNLPVTQEEQ